MLYQQSIRQILENCKTWPIARQQVWNVIKLAQKLGHVLAKTEFLCECRKNNKLPNFILYETSLSDSFINNNIVKSKLVTLRKSMLNSAINDAHRAKNSILKLWSKASSNLPNDAKNMLRVVITESRLFRRNSLIEKFTKLTPLNDKIIKKSNHCKNEVKVLDNATVDKKTMSLLEKGQSFAPSKKRLSSSELIQVQIALQKLKFQLEREGLSFNAFSPDCSLREYYSSKILSLLPARFYVGKETKSLSCKFESEFNEFALKVNTALGLSSYGSNSSEALTALIASYVKSSDTNGRSRTDPTSCICKTDKSGSFIVAKRESIVIKVIETLHNDPAFDEVPNFDRLSWAYECARCFKALNLDKVFTKNVVLVLKPTSHSFGKLQPLIKDHKEGYPIRPVINLIDTPFEAVDYLLSLVFKQLIPFVKTRLLSTVDFVKSFHEKYPNNVLPPGTVIGKLDVNSMFTSIPRQQLIVVLRNFLTNHQNAICLFGMSIVQVLDLLNVWLSNIYFEFDGRIFQQVKGAPMGGHCSVFICDIYMYAVEKEIARLSNNASYNLSSWYRFVDDVCFSMQNSAVEVKTWFEKVVNKADKNVTFKMEVCDRVMPFLDCEILLFGEHQRYSISHYRKPMASNHLLMADSNHPRSVKFNVLCNELSRMLQIADPHEKPYEIDKFMSRAHDSGYDEKLISQVLNKVENKSSERNDSDRVRFISLPFLDEIARRKVATAARRLSQASNTELRVSWRSTSLKHSHCSRFTKPSCMSKLTCHGCDLGLENGDCQLRHVVYMLKCLCCGLRYIGCTHRPVMFRMSEHQSCCANKTIDQAMGHHYSDQQHLSFDLTKSKPFTPSILHRCRNSKDMYIAEKLFIKELKPEINKIWNASRSVQN